MMNEFKYLTCEEINSFVCRPHEGSSSFSHKKNVIEHGEHLRRWLMNGANDHFTFRCQIFKCLQYKRFLF